MEQKILQILNRGKIHEITAHELAKLFNQFLSWALVNCSIIEIHEIKSWKHIDKNGGVVMYKDSEDLFLYYLNNVYHGRIN